MYPISLRRFRNGKWKEPKPDFGPEISVQPLPMDKAITEPHVNRRSSIPQHRYMLAENRSITKQRKAKIRQTNEKR
jgi:hypothetical protein